MKCAFCGQESRRTDVCEHCGGPMAPAPEPGLASGLAAGMAAPSAASQPRASVASPPVDVTQRVPPPAPLGQTQPVPPPGAYGAVPAQGPYGPVQPGQYPPPQAGPYGPPPAPGAPAHPPSVYTGPPPQGAYPGAPIGPATMNRYASYGLPAAAVTPTLAAAATSRYRVPAGEKWERCLALTLPMLLICALIVHFFPTTGVMWGMLFFGTFMLGLLIGASAAVPSYDDCYADVGVIMIITVILGPTIGMIAYIVTALVRQEFNTAMLALGIANIVLRIVVFMATGAGMMGLLIALVFSLFDFSGLSIATCFMGWILSSFFRPMED